MLFSPIMLDKFERTQKDTKALHTFEHCSCAFLNSSLMLIDFWRPARPLKRLHLAQKMFVVAGMRDAGFPRWEHALLNESFCMPIGMKQICSTQLPSHYKSLHTFAIFDGVWQWHAWTHKAYMRVNIYIYTYVHTREIDCALHPGIFTYPIYWRKPFKQLLGRPWGKSAETWVNH